MGYNFQLFHFKISSYRCALLYSKVWLYFFPPVDSYKIGNVFLQEKKTTTGYLVEIQNGKGAALGMRTSGIQFQTCHFMTRRRGSCQDFSLARVGTGYSAIFGPWLPHLYKDGSGLTQRWLI